MQPVDYRRKVYFTCTVGGFCNGATASVGDCPSIWLALGTTAAGTAGCMGIPTIVNKL